MSIMRFAKGRKPRRYVVALSLSGEPGKTAVVLYPAARGSRERAQVVSLEAGRNLMLDLQRAFGHLDGEKASAESTLAAIHTLLDGTEWSSETLDRIRDKLESIGLPVREFEPEE